jgi:hypothetical protein
MAIARLKSGRTFVTYDGINRLIAPAKVGPFAIPPEVATIVSEASRSITDGPALLHAFDIALGEDIRLQGLLFGRVTSVAAERPGPADAYGRRLSIYPEIPAEVLSREFQRSTLPHFTHATELHHVVLGAMIMGLELPNEEQAIVYVGAGETLRLVDSVQHWPYDPADGSHTVVSYFDQFPQRQDGVVIGDMPKTFTGLKVKIQ